MVTKRLDGLGEADEVAWDETRALVDQLIEGVLPVGSRFAPVHRARLVAHARAVNADALAIALHGELLEIGWESRQVLAVRKHGNGLRVEKVRVPESQQAHDDRQVLLEGRRAEVFV